MTLGVLLIIFEARPDCLPQISALALRSGNGLLLKGGKEAEHSNACLHRIISETIRTSSNEKLSSDVVGLVTSRSDIASLLRMDQYIDLVIPRGSSSLVQYIKSNTRIPVMGHAEGVCHVYIDAQCNAEMAIAVTIDAKTDYPSACNAAETLLLHQDLIASGVADLVLRALRAAGVSLFGGPRAMELGITDRAAVALNKEYGELAMTVEVVCDVKEAVHHINAHGRYMLYCFRHRYGVFSYDVLRCTCTVVLTRRRSSPKIPRLRSIFFRQWIVRVSFITHRLALRTDIALDWAQRWVYPLAASTPEALWALRVYSPQSGCSVAVVAARATRRLCSQGIPLRLNTLTGGYC